MIRSLPTDERDAVVAHAEDALARGDADAATEGFERAGTMRHSADSEMGLVRTAMQTGHYRRALAFCAHVAGEHLDESGPAVLYSWLLRIGGRVDLSDRVLHDALERAKDPIVVASENAMSAPLPVADAVLLLPPHRVAPYPIGFPGETPPPPDAVVVSSAVLLRGGSNALLPFRPEQHGVWLRDGLGRTREAVVDEHFLGGSEAASIWRLKTVLAAEVATPRARPPVPGMPVYTAVFAKTETSTPAWPWMRTGFLGARAGAGDTYRLGVDLAGATGGSPVLDRQGHWVGIALIDRQGRSVMQPLESESSGPAPDETGDDLAFDLIYERLLQLTLQVISV